MSQQLEDLDNVDAGTVYRLKSTVALNWYPFAAMVWADSGYCGPALARWVRGPRPKLSVQVVKHEAGQREFAVLPRRWVVERTFGWLMKQRRLARDYEVSLQVAET